MPRVADLLAAKGSAVYTIDQEKRVYDAIKSVSYTHLTLPTN